MSGLCWMVVVLGIFLSAQNRVAGYSKEELADLVKVILNTYQPTFKDRPIMFAMAVTIPFNERRKKYDFSGVKDEGQVLRKKIEKCSVYISKQITAATVLKYKQVDEQCPNEPVQWVQLLQGCRKATTWTDFQSDLCPKKVREENLDKLRKKNGLVDHAEYRVLDNFRKLIQNFNKQDLLLFYSWGSPCDDKCTNEAYPDNILKTITQIRKWKNYAYVFSKPFKPAQEVDKQTLQNNLKTALTKLGNKVDLSKIYRCDENDKGTVVCESCSNKGQVLDYCIKDDKN